MLRAVTFDWGDTLMRDAWDEDVARAGSAAGLAALGEREDLPDVEAIAAWWANPERPIWDQRREDEVDSLGETRRCFSDLGVELGDDEVTAYYEALHRDWAKTIGLSQHAYALLEALRKRELKLAIVSNVGTPGRLVRELLDEQGLTERVDAVVLSCEVGKRKPHRAIFERALDELGVAAEDTLHVGDRRYHDVHGAAALGMSTVQALWFRADEDAESPEPDYEAFTMFDVLNIVDRALAGVSR
jgi:HAD superfamily hydrolase (TIGR01549 family)